MNNYIITGVVKKPRHTIRITVSDSIYRKIKYHAVDRNLTTSGAAEDLLENSVLKDLIIFDPHAEDEETNRFNNIKYYLNEIKRNVKESSLLIQDENYSQMAENFISFIETLLCNPEFCFIETKLPGIEKACTEILVAAWDASERARLSKFHCMTLIFINFCLYAEIKNEKDTYKEK